jgi:hypothetical protein
MVKINAQLEIGKAVVEGIQRFFAWTYKYLKGIPLGLTWHKIELDIIIPQAHHVRYKLNPNYVIMVKQDIDKLLTVRFIESIEKATWLSPIVIVSKKNGKLKIYIDFKKLNFITLVLGSRPKQRFAKVRTKSEVWESHFMFPRV